MLVFIIWYNPSLFCLFQVLAVRNFRITLKFVHFLSCYCKSDLPVHENFELQMKVYCNFQSFCYTFRKRYMAEFMNIF